MQAKKPSLGLIIQWGSDGWTGGPNYLKNLALAVSALPPHRRPRLVFLVRPEQVATIGQYQNVLSLADDVRVFPSDVPADDIDMFYPCVADMKLVPRGARVYWIPDFQHCHLPQMFRQDELHWRDHFFGKLARGKEMVVLSSQSALDDFQRFFPVSCPTHVLRFSTSPEPGWTEGDPEAVKARYGLSTPYLMCCNQFWAHKDHKTLFAALALLRGQGLALPLICTGATEDYRNPEYFQSLKIFLEEQALTDQVKILGLLDRKDQIQLLRGAAAVVQPSLFEGWSTVIEDSRLLGKTVVYSDIPVHLEQAVPHGLPFKAGDPQDLARVLEAFPTFAATAGTEIERQALASNDDARLRFGLEIRHVMDRVLQEQPRPLQATPQPKSPTLRQSTTDLAPGNNFQIKGPQWYAPPLAGASTLAASLFEPDTYKNTLAILKQLPDDDYIVFLRGFLSRGIKQFGAQWRYADICTVLQTLAEKLRIETYLEIGVHQGRNLAMVVSRRPEVQAVAFALWPQAEAALQKNGPEFVREQVTKLGHTGSLSFIEGNSHETLPRYFAAHPRQSFELMTVDGDHTPDGAAADLREVLPHLRIGGAIVFGDIAHPNHPGLRDVWRNVILSRPDMSGFEFTELGYGVAFAVRMR